MDKNEIIEIIVAAVMAVVTGFVVILAMYGII